MRSKLILGNLVLVALVSLALWPAIASASPVITYPTGSKLVINNKLRSHNVGTTFFTTTESKLECSVTETTGTLLTNTGNNFEINVESVAFTGTGFNQDCTSTRMIGDVRITTNPSTNGLPWCIWSKEGIQNKDEASLIGGKCTETPAKPIRLILDYTKSSLECQYEKSGAIPVVFKTHPEEAILTISEAEFKTTTPLLCPASFKLDTTLTFEKDEAGTNPIYIS